MASNKEIMDRLNKLDAVTASQNKLLKVLARQFAWYWIDNRRKCLAFISRINKDKADLVAFTADYSGAIHTPLAVPLFVPNPDWTDEEQVRVNTWEPVLELPEILKDFKSAIERMEDEKDPQPEEPEKEATKAEKKSSLKGKLATAGK